MGLPPLVLQALAFAVDYLKPFGMEAVLQMSNSFRPFNTRQEMALSTNTLTYAPPSDEGAAEDSEEGRRVLHLTAKAQRVKPVQRQVLHGSSIS